ncbi:Glycoside hydrolase, superfamily [Phaffia rhodozyma]|uniref:Glycoside hydrolase, superfamily n=1 Tax=Phaffia rhodozyma TaxID=264483 RepID=A0A0F7SG95_PHARH|nr:Glycoside hydrolase, superfamily [Phaffia rhodozyma]
MPFSYQKKTRTFPIIPGFAYVSVTGRHFHFWAKSRTFALALAVCHVFLTASLVNAATVISGLQAGSLPANASQLLSNRLIGFSIETAYVVDFLGTPASPNSLVLNLIGQVANRTGGISFRPGGITVDSSIYEPSLSEPLVRIESATGGIYQTQYGPGFFESMNLLPSSTEYIMDLNFGNDSWEIAKDEAEAALSAMNGKIIALELGNEPDQYNAAQRTPISSWGPQEYTEEFLTWSRNLTSALNLSLPFFQAGAFANDPTASALITTEDVVALGIGNDSSIKTFSQHMYQYSTCDSARDELATLDALVNHKNITAYVDLWKPQTAAAKSVGAELVIGEFNSVSCSGKQNVSNTFGQALWLADTILYSAYTNISRMYSHQGATLVLQSSDQSNTVGFSWYDFVYPLNSTRNGPSRSTPSFVSYLLLAEAISSTANTSQITYIPLEETYPDLAIYPIYDSAVRDVTVGPARMVVLNLGSQSDLSINVTSLGFTSSSGTTVKYMNSTGGPSSTVTTEATWAGQSYESGLPVGTEAVYTLGSDGLVALDAYQGVLLVLNGNSSTSSGSGSGTTSSLASPTATNLGSGKSEAGRKMGGTSTLWLGGLVSAWILIFLS